MKRWSNPSIRTTVVVFVTLAVSAAALASGLFFYWRSRAILTANVRSSIDQLLDRVNGRVEEQIGLIDSIFPLFAANPIISDYLEPQSLHYGASQMEKKLEIERQMNYLLINTYLWSERYMNAVYLFDGSGDYAVSRYSGGADEAGRNREAAARLSPEKTGLMILPSAQGSRSLYFCRNIYSVYSGEVIASIVMDIDQTAFQSVYSQGADDGIICLFGPDGTLLSSHGEAAPRLAEALSGLDGADAFRLENETYIAASRRLDRSSLKSSVAVPESAVFRELNGTLLRFVLLLAAMTALLLPLTALFSVLITRPIKIMRSQVENLTAGERPALPAGKYAEFQELYDALTAMLDERDQYYSELYEKQLLLKNAELKSLQTQINPHFLFNVLDTVGWKAAIAGEDEIYNMVVALGELLRGNILAREEDEIPLQQEIGYVKFYLYLQETRFEGKFTARLDIPPEVLDCLVPRLSVQPFVENAIVHGIEGKEGVGSLHVRAFCDHGDLVLEIQDDGVGYRPDEAAAQPAKRGHTHVAMKNVDRRIELLYGSGYGLKIDSAPGRGTTVTMRVPVHTKTHSGECRKC